MGEINYSTVKIKLLFKTILNDDTLEAFQLKPGIRKLRLLSPLVCIIHTCIQNETLQLKCINIAKKEIKLTIFLVWLSKKKFQDN